MSWVETFSSANGIREADPFPREGPELRCPHAHHQGWLHQPGGDDLLLPALQLGAGRPHGLRTQLPGE